MRPHELPLPLCVATLVIAVATIKPSDQADRANDENFEGNDHSNIHDTVQFDVFVEMYGKKYADPAEYDQRRKIFDENTRKIIEHNKLYERKIELYKLSQSYTSDLTEQEIEAHEHKEHPDDDDTSTKSVFGSHVSLIKREVRQFLKKKTPFPEETLIADLRNCTPVIRNQASCGACYAFSITSYLEWHYCHQFHNTSMIFAPQYLVDCGQRYRLNGCDGAPMKYVRNFIKREGVIHENRYPFNGLVQTCGDRYLGNKGPFNITPTYEVEPYGWKRIIWNATEWKATLHEEPILIEIQTPRDFEGYVRGIHMGRNCRGTKHAMLVVGYGVQNDHPFFLVKNSFGEYWGESGYWRVSEQALMDPQTKCLEAAWKSHFYFINPNDMNEARAIQMGKERMIEAYKDFKAYVRRDVKYNETDKDYYDPGRDEEDLRAPDPNDVG